MTEPGSTGQARPTDGTAWIDDSADVDPEAVAGHATLGEPPLEVSEGDLADQRVEVPLDDDLDRE